jgi:hypothetical protein
MVDQKAPSRAEQEDNREIIRAYQGGNREITGGEQAPRDSAGSSGMRRHSAPIQPLECGGSNLPTLLDCRTCPSSIPPGRGRHQRAEARSAPSALGPELTPVLTQKRRKPGGAPRDGLTQLRARRWFEGRSGRTSPSVEYFSLLRSLCKNEFYIARPRKKINLKFGFC